MTLKSKIVTITPEYAAKLLATNTANRPISKNAVAAMARDMTHGHWRLNGDAIRLDEHDAVKDGQHRLAACVMANVPFETLLVTGLSREDQLTIDRGRTRSIGDNLTIAHGITSGKAIAAAVRNLVMFAEQDVAATPTISEYVDLLEAHPGIVESALLTNGTVIGRPAVLAAIHYVGSRFQHLPDRANAFVSVFQTGVPDYEGDAAHTLREMLVREKARGVKRLDFKTYSLFANAWEKFSTRVPVRYARGKEDFRLKGWDETTLEIPIPEPPAGGEATPEQLEKHDA